MMLAWRTAIKAPMPEKNDPSAQPAVKKKGKGKKGKNKKPGDAPLPPP